jgi:polyphosphate kinase 2 (PPK2 family)
MLGEKYTQRCRVKPGEEVRLDDFSTTTLGISGKPEEEEEGVPVFQELRSKLANQQRILYAEGKKKLLIVMQAMDTGGKDGCVRKLFSRVDPQGVRVTPFKAPSTRELSHDFLWRVHIVDFEQMLVDEGTTILKFFLNISKDEQRRRLQSRLDRPEKHWKFFPEDLADRARWDDFQTAYEDVFARTSAKEAPWFVIPADYKWYRDMAVSQIVTHALDGMGLDFPKVEWDPSKIVVE